MPRGQCRAAAEEQSFRPKADRPGDSHFLEPCVKNSEPRSGLSEQFYPPRSGLSLALLPRVLARSVLIGAEKVRAGRGDLCGVSWGQRWCCWVVGVARHAPRTPAS